MADNYQDMEQLLQSISDLMQEEKKYEQHIKEVTQNIRRLYDEEAFDKSTFENLSYITHEDMRSLESFKDQSVMAIKAPPGTTLEVPDPDEGMPSGKRRFQIFLKSTGAEAVSFSLPIVVAGCEDVLELTTNCAYWRRWSGGCVLSSTACRRRERSSCSGGDGRSVRGGCVSRRYPSVCRSTGSGATMLVLLTDRTRANVFEQP